MMASLSANSVKQYDTYLRKWWNYCKNTNSEVFIASVPTVVHFLTELFNEGAQNGTLNSCRSALAILLGPNISKDDRIQRFFKGVFRLRPPLPKYNYTWDTNCVLEHLCQWYPNEEMSFDKLSRKTITLLALTTAHRLQTLTKINIKNINVSSNHISIKIPDFIKTSRAGFKQPILYIPFFNQRPAICPATALLCYINKSAPLRKSDLLFVGIKKPHKSVGTQTLSRWVKTTLGECGIDTSVFSAHSTRHASTSRAHSLGVNIDAIRSTAGWSGNSSVFARFYNRTILNNDCTSLARSIIDS
ncbi:hypothetical protein ABMA28_014488 [Loxostege sticticalis]|uniref:Tyr recombinase domain-containing protein n=1 Tax=Loxostege sticticalis TaxID=481309 RepID=A0ABD0TH71_LOXSC